MMPDEILIEKNLLFHFQQLAGHEKGNWGKMNAWQTVEHLAKFFDVSSGKKLYDIVTPAEYLPKYMEFLQSEKEFRENTKAPENIIGEEPEAVISPSYQKALEALQDSINNFFSFFKLNPESETIHPVFGSLNYSAWLRLHGKHVRHHLRQFSLPGEKSI